MHRASLAGLGFGNSDPRTNGEYSLLARLAARWESPTLIDAGAHEGEWTVAALAIEPSVSIHALEPNSACLPALERALAGRAQIHHVGLGRESGELVLYAPPGMPSLGSVHRRDLSSHGLPNPEPIGEVSLVTLDEFCVRNQIDHVDFLKLDLEGHELAALEGAARLIEGGALDVVQFEFGGAAIDSHTFLRDIFDVLGDGYAIHRLLHDGLDRLDYGEEWEIFAHANYVAIRTGAGLS
jgi:FkbM family methyltransferase